jgi:hypothetical protein
MEPIFLGKRRSVCGRNQDFPAETQMPLEDSQTPSVKSQMLSTEIPDAAASYDRA